MSQVDVLYQILLDKKPHSNFSLVGEVYKQTGPSIARLAARLYDIKKKYGVEIDSWEDSSDRRKHWYRLKRVVKIIS